MRYDPNAAEPFAETLAMCESAQMSNVSESG
jgi:hypothetical protein